MADLAELTTLRVGGPAGTLIRAGSAAEVADAVEQADRAGRPVLVVAGGSNLLISDEGFPGDVVVVRSQGVEVLGSDDGQILLRVAAGQRWDDVVALAVESGWSGIEALSGIPGSAGATPIQNVGAYGAEVAAVLEEVAVLDRGTGNRTTLTPSQLGLAYRSSNLKCHPGRWVVLGVTMRLAQDALSLPIRYAELARRLGVAVGQRAPLAQVRAAVLEVRREKGMVLNPDDHDTWSAGSFFTNPILPPAQAGQLPEGAPRFPQPDGRVKTSAAWLISNSGFERGFAVRPGAPASLSTKHSLALTNRGGASASDLLELARAVRAGVRERFGILLENEPVLVGCSL